MSELKFDPVTGQPINQPAAQPGMPNMQQPMNNGPKFDPVTGQAIQPGMPNMQQPMNNGPKFDPVTGQPIQPGMPNMQQPMNNGPKFDPVTGQPIQPGMPNMQRMQQPNGPRMQFDPKTGKPIQPVNNINNNGGKSNKGLVIGVVAALIAVVGIGGFVLVNGSKKKSTTVEDPTPVVEASVETSFFEPEEDPEVAAATEATSEEVVAVTEATSEEVIEEPKEETKVATKTNSEVDPSSLFSFNYEGTNYSLPMPIADLMADGWQYNDDNDAKMQLGTSQTEYVYLQVPGDTSRNHVTVHVKNFSNNAMALSDCYIVSIDFDDYSMHKLGKTVTVQNGAIKLGESKAEDVIAVLGEPDNTYDGSSGSQSLTYYGEHDNYGIDSSVRFYFDDSKLLSSIDIENNVEPEDFEQVEVSDEVPEYLSNYVEPKELGLDPFSGNIQLDKKLYTLPCPMQKFLDNGWSYNVNDDTLGAGQRCLVPVAIGNDRVYLEAVNPLDYAVHLNNTIVVSVQVSVYSRTKLDFQLPGGINLTSTDADVKKALESSKIDNYEYKKDYKKYTIPFDQSEKPDRAKNYIKIDMDDDGTLNGLEVQNYGWLLED